MVIIASVEPVAVAPVSVVILTVISPMNSLAQVWVRNGERVALS